MSSNSPAQTQNDHPGNFTLKIAGMSCTCNCLLPPSSDVTGADGEIQVDFFSTPLDSVAPAPQVDGDWYPFAQLWQATYCMFDAQQTDIWLRQDGRHILIYDGFPLEDPHQSEARGALVRLTVPFAAALQNKPVIHASAIQVEGEAVAFVGGSGAGKSTLAQQLNQLGFTRLVDDLLPCRLTDSGIGVPVLTSQILPIRAFYLIHRSTDNHLPEIVRLTQDQHMLNHLQHSFSELVIPRIWKVLFQLYEQIALTIPGFRLMFPDDINYLPEVSTWLREILMKRRYIE